MGAPPSADLAAVVDCESLSVAMTAAGFEGHSGGVEYPRAEGDEACGVNYISGIVNQERARGKGSAVVGKRDGDNTRGTSRVVAENMFGVGGSRIVGMLRNAGYGSSVVQSGKSNSGFGGKRGGDGQRKVLRRTLRGVQQTGGEQYVTGAVDGYDV